MPDETPESTEAECNRLMAEEQKAWDVWQDVMDNHPSRGAYINAVRATDRFIDQHPELERPEVVDKDVALSKRYDQLEQRHLATSRELEEAQRVIADNRERYGD